MKSSEKISVKFEHLKNDSTSSLESKLMQAEVLAEQALMAEEIELQCYILVFMGIGYRMVNDAFKSISSLNKAFIQFNSKTLQDKKLLHKYLVIKFADHSRKQ